MAKRRVKRRLKLGNIFLTISFISFLVLVGVYFTNGNKLDEKTINDVKKKIPVVSKKEDKEVVNSVSVIAVGDNLIHSSVYKDANRLAGYNGYDFKPMYELIKPIVSKYDIAYY